MKRIINGKNYDTEKARLIHAAEFNIGNPPESVTVSLYRKRTGEFFFDRKDMFSENITPVSFEIAKTWAESNNVDREKIQNILTQPEDKDKKTGVYVWMKKEKLYRIRAIASCQKITLSDLLDKVIEKGLLELEK